MVEQATQRKVLVNRGYGPEHATVVCAVFKDRLNPNNPDVPMKGEFLGFGVLLEKRQQIVYAQESQMTEAA